MTTNTILGVPYDNYSILGPKTVFQLLRPLCDLYVYRHQDLNPEIPTPQPSAACFLVGPEMRGTRTFFRDSLKKQLGKIAHGILGKWAVHM